MAGTDPSPTMLEKIFKKRKRNIELPNESGITDERLPKKGETADKVKQGIEILREMRRNRKSAS